MKKAGIWLDKRNAIIVHLDNISEEVSHVTSQVDEGNITGGSRSSTPYGSQGVVSEVHILEKRKQQLKKYYQELLSRVVKADQVLIMGPAEAKKALLREFRNKPSTSDKELFVKNADSMTEPQIIAKIRSFFQK